MSSSDLYGSMFSPYRSLLQYYCLYSDGNIRQNYGLNCLVLRRVDVGYTVV